MSKKIIGAEYNLAKIFSSEFDFNIPSYQRPYAWTTEQTDELFQDLFECFENRDDDTYFLGSIVLIKEEGQPTSEVIDGQQRLTTLTILLAAITSSLKSPLREDFEEFVWQPRKLSMGLEKKPRLSLRERDRDFFQEYVQAYQFKKLEGLDELQIENDALRNIKHNSKVLLENLHDAFGGDEESIKDFGTFLLQRCYLVVVSTPNKQSAFRVFSVLNNRGLNLLLCDMMKADIIGSIPAKKQSKYNDIWEDIEARLGRDNFNDLFSHIRMIFAKSKPKRNLLDEFKSEVVDKVSSPEVLIEQHMKPLSEAFDMINSADYRSKESAAEINQLLRHLQHLGFWDWLPCTILYLARHKCETKNILLFLRNLERLAAYMCICQVNATRRIKRFAEVISAIENDRDPSWESSRLTLTRDEKSQMLEALKGDVYTLTPKRRKYLVLRLESFVSDKTAQYDTNRLTIEHILPQNPEPGTCWENNWEKEDERRFWLHKIGNLIPLNRSRNSKARNRGFKEKKNAYYAGKDNVTTYALASQVLRYNEWTPRNVADRQDQLIEIMKEKWHLED